MEIHQPTVELLDSFKSILNSADYTDLTIFCGDDVHKVHKVLVCPRSTFFAAACKFGEEAVKNEITLEEVEPRLVKLMINYLYQLDYTVETTTVENIPQVEEPKQVPQSPEESPKFTNVPMFSSPFVPPFAAARSAFDTSTRPFGTPSQPIRPTGQAFGSPVFSSPVEEPDTPTSAAKKYKLKSKKSKGNRVEIADESAPEPEPAPLPDQHSPLVTHAEMYALADRYNVSGLKALAKEKFTAAASDGWDSKTFPEAMHVAYTSTPETDMGLRDVVIQTVGGHMQILEKPAVEATMRELNGLAFDLLKDQWRKHGGVWGF